MWDQPNNLKEFVFLHKINLANLHKHLELIHGFIRTTLNQDFYKFSLKSSNLLQIIK